MLDPGFLCLKLPQRVLKGERVPDSDTERRRKDGTTIEVSRVLSPVTGPDGSVAGVADIARDRSAHVPVLLGTDGPPHRRGGRAQKPVSHLHDMPKAMARTGSR